MTRPILHAYVLAADPTWLRSSVQQYYESVDRIIVSYDEASRGWAGAPVPVEECLRSLRHMDRDRKMVYVPGCFSDPTDSATFGETAQRTSALEVAARGADWVLQLDTDEVLPQPEDLYARLAVAAEIGAEGVEWPMRVLYRRRRRDYLEVVDWDGQPRFEYPGPVAVRPTARLAHARQIDGPILRCAVAGDNRSLQLRRPEAPGETRLSDLTTEAAILHNSWAREPAVVRQKVRSWGHNMGWRSDVYYWLKWYPAPVTWRWLKDFHPFSDGLWPRLAPMSDVHSVLVDEDR